MTVSPRVSIIVPNYNHLPFLPERLKSIAAQSYTDYELILLDDASTDGSTEFLKDCAQQTQAKLLLNETNSGSPFHQWNRGVREARGLYVWIAESDDSARPEFLQTLVDVLDQHPQVGLVECDSERIDAAGNVLGRVERDAYQEHAARWQQDFIADGRQEVAQFLYLQNTIPSASAVLFRRDVYLAAGEADPQWRLTGDWLQWVRMLLHADRGFVARPLSKTRVHPQTQREQSARRGDWERQALQTQREIRKRVAIDPAMVRLGAERYARSRLQNLRAGRAPGSVRGDGAILRELLACDRIVAASFAAQLPYALLAGGLKRAGGLVGP